MTITVKTDQFDTVKKHKPTINPSVNRQIIEPIKKVAANTVAISSNDDLDSLRAKFGIKNHKTPEPITLSTLNPKLSVSTADSQKPISPELALVDNVILPDVASGITLPESADTGLPENPASEINKEQGFLGKYKHLILSILIIGGGGLILWKLGKRG